MSMLDLLLPAGILLAGVIDDLRSRKIHNQLILILAVLAILFVLGKVIWSYEIQHANPIFHFFSQLCLLGLLPLIGKSFLALCLSLPLIFLRVMGGGDMKLYIVLSFVSSPRLIFFSLFFGLAWGGVLGLIKVCLDKKLFQILKNLCLIIQFKTPHSDKLSVFPFSVSLLIGWLTAITY